MGISTDIQRRNRRKNAYDELHQKLRGLPLPANWEDRPELLVELAEEAAARLDEYKVDHIVGQGMLLNNQVGR